MTAESYSDKTVPEMEVHIEQRCGIEYLHEENIASTDIH